MLKNKLQKITPNIKDNITNNKKYQGIKIKTNSDNMKTQEKDQKKNLPEIKLAKIKTKPDSDSENEHRGRNINNTNMQLNNKNLLNKKKKSHSLMKKNDLVFPKINNNNINEFDNYDKKFSLHNNHNNHNIQKKKNNFGLHNGNNNIALLQGGLLKNDKNKDFEGDKNDKLRTKNETLNTQKIKSKIPKSQINNIKSIHQQKLKAIKKESSTSSNINDNKNLLNCHIPLIPINNNKLNTFNNNNNTSPSSLFTNSINASSNTNSLLPITNPTTSPVAVTTTSTPTTTTTSTATATATTTPIVTTTATATDIDTDKSSSSIVNELKEMELLTEKLNMLNNLLSIFNNPPVRKTVNITPEIFNNTYKNFEVSLTSIDGDIKEGEMIKGFGYNSSMGNIRDYNEDTITATKVKLNDDENNYFYFFGVYDGHGGKGCSFYLKENLHKNVNEFSSNGLKLGIEKTEEKFKKEEALNENGEIKDSSGSCGIVAMIKGKKLIIGNVGDSRLVIFKNGFLSFTTEDHKPGSEIEKKRIEAAGGKIYQTPSIYPLYQNGKEIENPWRVLPGRLSVSRTFGDIEAKDENFGGMKGVVVALPDITEIELNDEYNFIVLGCDGIFDVISNEELLECIKIVLKEKKINEVIKDEDIHELCGDFAAMIIKSALAKDSFDNVSCIVIALNLNGLL